jgi:hypothetical protein
MAILMRNSSANMGIEAFTIPFSQPAVDDLHDRLRRTRWPDEIAGANWEYGVDLKFLQQIGEYWRDRFDWEAQVERPCPENASANGRLRVE